MRGRPPYSCITRAWFLASLGRIRSSMGHRRSARADMINHGANDRVNVSGHNLVKEIGKREGSDDGKSFI